MILAGSDCCPHWQPWLQATAEMGKVVTARPLVAVEVSLVEWRLQDSVFALKTSTVLKVESSSWLDPDPDPDPDENPDPVPDPDSGHGLARPP